MHTSGARVTANGSAAARWDIGDIFRRHGAEYRRVYAPSAEHRRVMSAIEQCRTAALGGHLYVCDHCDHEVPLHNSCRNRHCGKCQALSQARWVEQRRERLVNTHYFHVVFTLPEQLRPLAMANRRKVYSLMFDAVAQTLLTLGEDPKRLGARLGITAVLHTWNRAMQFHPHLHCVVTGGGLTDRDQWVSTRSDFLFPVRVMSALFRGKLLSGLRRFHERGELTFAGRCAGLSDPREFNRLIDGLYSQGWVVYCKRPFAGPQQVFDYLGHYTHRVAISNYRLREVTDEGVTFATRDGHCATLAPLEFIRRLLLHVLPKGMQKIRHYGLVAPRNAKTRLRVAQRLLDPAKIVVPGDSSLQPEVGGDDTDDAPSWVEKLLQLTGDDPTLCPRCQRGNLQRRTPIPLGNDTS